MTNEASSSSLIESSNISEAVDASWELTTISPIEGVLLTVPPAEGVLLDQQQAKAFLPGEVFEGGESGLGKNRMLLRPWTPVLGRDRRADSSEKSPQCKFEGKTYL